MLQKGFMVLLVLAALTACEFQGLTGGETIPSGIAGQVAEAINAKRKQQQSCGTTTIAASTELKWSTPLAKAAETQAKDLINNNRLALVGQNPQTHPKCDPQSDSPKGDPLQDPHCGADGTGVDDRALKADFKSNVTTQFGEIIALTTDGKPPTISSFSNILQPQQNTNITLAVDGWLKSPAHCSQMLRPKNSQVGVSMQEVTTGDKKQQLWVAVFAGTP